jgi:site-specific DNA-cytosine methylase
VKTALTFSSGAGGMCAGLAQAGFDIIGGNGLGFQFNQ